MLHLKTTKTAFRGLMLGREVSPAGYLCNRIRERSSILYLRMAQEFWDFANLAVILLQHYVWDM